MVDEEGGQLGILSVDDALKRAEDIGLDLVEVSPNASPPVCRLMDYGKYKYQMSKKAHEAKKKQTVILVKEVKFRTRTDEHDFQFKLRNIKKFLAQGNKVKAAVFFRGREITHPDIGRSILDRIVEATKDEAVVEMATKFEGRNMILILGPLAAPIVQAPKKAKNKDVKEETQKQPDEVTEVTEVTEVKEEKVQMKNKEEQEGTEKDA